MADLRTTLGYHLPLTRVTLKGDVTERTDLAQDNRMRTATSQIELGTAADGNRFYRIKLSRRKFSDNSLSLEFDESGLLVSTKATSAGRLGQVVKNVFGFVTTVAGALGSLSFLGAAPMAGLELAGDVATSGTDPTARKYKMEHPTLAKRREELREAIDAVASRLIASEKSLATETDPKAREASIAHSAQLENALARLRKEAGPLESHFEAWKSRKENAVTTAHEIGIDLSALPTRERVDAWSAIPGEDELGPFWPVFDLFRVVLARRDLVLTRKDTSSPSEADLQLNNGGEYAGVVFRRPRPVELSLYTVSRDESQDKELLVLGKRTVEYVVDEDSPLGFIEFGDTKWSERTAELTFTSLGTLKTLKSSKTSELAAATGTLKELPAEVLSALKQANQIVDEAQKIQLQGVEQRVAELEQRKKVIQARIAVNGALSTEEQISEVKRLGGEIELLKAKKQLGVAARELSRETGAGTIELQTELTSLKIELEKAQIERLKVAAELAKLKGTNG